jgi:hypothetical protein
MALVRYLLWHGGKWYLKQRLRSRRAALSCRLPSRRATLLGAGFALSALVVSVAVARRPSG